MGPDNGLPSVAASRARKCEAYAIRWRPKELSHSFHGRDLFAPVAAMLARGTRSAAKLRKSALAVSFGPGDLREVIYVDHFGNVMTGLRAGALVPGCTLRVKGRAIAHGRVFSEMPPGQPFWYENSLGLVELAANGASTQRALGIVVGDPIG